VRAPFWLRRPGLFVRGVLASRDRPDLDALGRIEDPEAFVWAILPHAARTFSACIALLPERSALPAAVAYLYCRMLDTYEDLVPDPATRDEALRRFAARLAEETNGSSLPGAAPTISASTARDARDQTHLILVRRAQLVDRVYAALPPAVRGVIRDLVGDMAQGMRWASETFASGGGSLEGDAPLLAYCRVVLGNPVVFTVRLVRLGAGVSAVLTPDELEDAMQVGELIQLANVTRDIEKDLARGIAYDATLRGDLGRSDVMLDAALKARVGAARDRLMRLALARGPSYARMLASMRLPRLSFARASAVLMLLFTERYWRACATRCGGASWSGPDSAFALLARALPALGSARRARLEIARIEGEFVAAAGTVAGPARAASSHGA
jgi:phytoene/squalene synthetase